MSKSSRRRAKAKARAAGLGPGIMTMRDWLRLEAARDAVGTAVAAVRPDVEALKRDYETTIREIHERLAAERKATVTDGSQIPRKRIGRRMNPIPRGPE